MGSKGLNFSQAETADGKEYEEPEEAKIWRFGVCACANPGRCLISMCFPCCTTGMLAKKTEAVSPPVAFVASFFLLPLMVCWLRGKVREQNSIDGSDGFEGTIL